MPEQPAEDPVVVRLEAIQDPVERATAAQFFLTNGRQTLARVERLRDQAIRQARKNQTITIDQLAARMKAGRHIVVDACREKKKEPVTS